MIKYSEQFKLSVVEHYLTGAVGFKNVARQHGVAAPMVRRWVARYRLHGMAGLSRKVSRYSADFKLSVLKHMWENSLSYTQTAAVFNIRSTVSVSIWEERFRRGDFEALERPRGRKPKKMDTPQSKPEPAPDDAARSREDLQAELDYLRAENAYLKKLQALVQAKNKPIAPKKRN